MPLYFVEVGTKFGAIKDVEGVTYASIAEALNEAERSARGLLAEAIIADRDPPLDVTVYDDRKQKIAKVVLKDLLPT